MRLIPALLDSTGSGVAYIPDTALHYAAFATRAAKRTRSAAVQANSTPGTSQYLNMTTGRYCFGWVDMWDVLRSTLFCSISLCGRKAAPPPKHVRGHAIERDHCIVGWLPSIAALPFHLNKLGTVRRAWFTFYSTSILCLPYNGGWPLTRPLAVHPPRRDLLPEPFHGSGVLLPRIQTCLPSVTAFVLTSGLPYAHAFSVASFPLRVLPGRTVAPKGRERASARTCSNVSGIAQHPTPAHYCRALPNAYQPRRSTARVRTLPDCATNCCREPLLRPSGLAF